MRDNTGFDAVRKVVAWLCKGLRARPICKAACSAVIPAQAGIQPVSENSWIPACAGMTAEGAGMTQEGAEMKAEAAMRKWIRTFLCAVLLGAASIAHAQTNVSGAITTDTVWSAANAPYVVNGEVTIQGGAVLSIEPGVTVFMSADAQLTVAAGAIQARGTEAQPIRVLSDKTRLGQSAAPGDWKQWIFTSGTVNTQLDEVWFEHGRGLAVFGSAPVFNRLNLRFHAGAAITLDLNASPNGVGNRATNNEINGIAVPAGDISADVDWGLRGIPYVVSTGRVSVGISPAIASVTPATLATGATVAVTLTGQRLSGLSAARFDRAGLSAEVLPGGSDTEAQLSVTAQPSAVAGAAALHVLTDAGEIDLAQAFTVQTGLSAFTFSPDALTLGVARSAELTLRSSSIAGAGGVQVALSSSQPAVASVPALVTIPAGATSVTTTVSTHAVGNVTLTAQAPNYVDASAAVTVRTLNISLPAGALVAPGLTRVIPISVSEPAPAGGLVIVLSSSHPAFASVPASITVPAGETQASFTLTGVAAGTAAISASANDYEPATLPVKVEVVNLGFSLSELSVPAELSQSVAITLSQPAPVGGVTINLSVTDAAHATVSPASITIAQGQTSGGTVLATVTGVAKGNTTLVASAAGLNAVSLPVRVSSKPELAFSVAKLTVGRGLKNHLLEVSLRRHTDGDDYMPNQALTLTLTSSDVSKAAVPATVTILANQSAVNFYVTGVEFSAATPVLVSAAATGYAAPTPLAVDVVAPVLTLEGVDVQRGLGSTRDDFYVSVITPGASLPQTAALDLPIDIAVFEPNPADVVDAIYSAPNGGSVITRVLVPKDSARTEPAYVGVPTRAGTYKVQAKAVGTTSANAPATSDVVNVNTAALKFWVNSMTVGKGLQSFEAYVYRANGDVPLNGADELTVNLSVSDASKVGVPATVTIPANDAFANIRVVGTDLTAANAAMVSASATGYGATATPLAVNVVTPELKLNALDLTRGAGSTRDDFFVSVVTPGASYPNQAPVADLPIQLSLVDVNPADTVDAFYNAPSGGTAVNQVLLPKDMVNSEAVFVGAPARTGSYRVQASAPGMAAATSDVVNVTAAQLKFSVGHVVVGQGLNTYAYEVYVYRAIDDVPFNGADELTINLSSNNPSKAAVPATVTIPANDSMAYFTVTGVDLTLGDTQVTASANGYGSTVMPLEVIVVTPQLDLSGIDAARAPVSPRDDFFVMVRTPDSPYSGNQPLVADLRVDLSLVELNPPGTVSGFHSEAEGGNVITSVLIRKDGTFSDLVYVDTPTQMGSYKVQAQAAGAMSNTSEVVMVQAPQLKFAAPNVVIGKGFRTYAFEVYVYRAIADTEFNGTEDVTVTLACNASAICSAPPSAVIPAGQAGVYVQLEGIALGSTTLSASAPGYTSPADIPVDVVAPQLLLDAGDTTVGAESFFRVYVSTPGSPYASSQEVVNAMAISLSSSAPNVATVPATTSIPAGSNFSDLLVLTGVSAGTTTLTASSPGLLSATSGVITINP